MRFLALAAAAVLSVQAASLGPQDGPPALMQAAVSDGAAAMKTLLDRGADLNAKTAAGDFEKVRMLVDKGADVNVRSALGNTPLLVAAGVDGNWESVKLLIEKGADVNAKNTTRFPRDRRKAVLRDDVSWKRRPRADRDGDRRGVRFLVGTRKSDGSWLVKSRTFPFQPYKESGFPHGKDQWICGGNRLGGDALVNTL